MLLLFGWTWWRVRKWQMALGIEISEAEKTVHGGFDNLKGVLSKYIGELLESKSTRDLKKREELLSRELAKEIEEAEKRMEKEVKDVRRPEKAHKDERR